MSKLHYLSLINKWNLREKNKNLIDFLSWWKEVSFKFFCFKYHVINFAWHNVNYKDKFEFEKKV